MLCCRFTGSFYFNMSNRPGKIICSFMLIFSMIVYSYSQSPAQVLAFERIIGFELNSGREILHIYSNRNPREPLTEYLLNYADFLEVFLSGDNTLWKEYKSNSARRLKDMEYYKNGDYYYYSIWNMHLHNAILRIKFGDYIRAGVSIYHFYKTLQDAISLQPDNNLNFQGKAVLELFFALIPEDYLWAFRLAGFKGDYERGIGFLNYYAVSVQKIPGFSQESFLVNLLVKLQLEDNPSGMIEKIEKRNEIQKLSSPLKYIYALALIKSGQSELAYRELLTYRPDSLENEIPFMYLLLGETMLYKGEKNADEHFKHFLNTYKGNDYRKVAWQKLAMYYLIENDRLNFDMALKNLESDGTLLTDPDRQAFHEKNYLPDYHPDLLRSRLRFDGGYYEEALSIIDGFQFKTKRQELEYLYRLGRINHKLGNLLNANVYYHKTIDADKGSGYYFAAFSALMLADMYAEKNEYYKAEDYYRLALRLNRGEYKRSIDFQIRRGLRKLDSADKII